MRTELGASQPRRAPRDVHRFKHHYRVIRRRGPLRPGCRCRAASRPGLVLDPFMGAGTVALVAEQHDRDWLGIELNPDYAAIAQSNIQVLLRHPFYKGVVRYKGLEYPGRHQAIVDPTTWQKVQDVLSAKDRSGEKTREHPHYLKGSLYCHCGFRMIVSHSRGRHGTVYPYFCCLGRHGKHNTCTKQAVLIETIEANVQDLYTRVQLAPELRDAIEQILIEELEAISEEARLERSSLEKRQARLFAEQTKLMRAHYADAVPVHLLKSEQQRLDRELAQARQRLQSLDSNIDTTRANLKGALDYAANAYKAYAAAGPKTRRDLNQFFFTRLTVEDDNSVTAELNEPYAILLSPHVIQAARHHATTAATPTPRAARTPTGTKKPRRPSGRRGLNYEQMVGGTGLEPVTPCL